MKADFYITYHHGDEMAARWIAAELKQAHFTTLSDSWDFLRGETALEKTDSMFGVSRFVMVLISEKFLEFFSVPAVSSVAKSTSTHIVRIEPCEIESVFGSEEYIDLAGIKEAEAVKRLLAAVGAAAPGKKETEPLPVAPLTPDEILAKRKQELDQLLESAIKHNYHMKLDLEQEVEKEVEVKNEKTGEMENRIERVWEPIPLETVLKDGKNYILVNPSGMGKTTFLTYAACAILDRDAHYPFLPLFFTCIGLNNRDGSIENFILRQVESFYTQSQGSLVSREWENLCVLIDALDQARDVDDIVSSLLLHDKPLHYKKAKIILSSRQNTADKVKEGFEKIRLKLPVAGEVQYYLGEENYKKLEGIIESSGELVKAPVLLEMLKAITEKGHVVSTLYNRAGLYTKFTRILLDQERSKPRFWQDPLSIRHFIDFELEQALEKIAFFSLADNQILEIPKEKLAQYCESPAKKEALLNIGIILEFFEDREQKIVFRHQSFQAYFAARYIYNQQPELFRELVSDIAFFYNDAWYEVMRFFVGLEKDPQKAEDIIDSIYQTKGERIDLIKALRLIFAVFLMSEARVSSEFVQRVYEKIRDLLYTNKPYLFSFFSIIDKFNKNNDAQRRFLSIIFEPLLRDEDSDVRCAAVNALGNIGAAQDIPLLEPLLRDEDIYVRSASIEAVMKFGTAGYIPLLKSLLRDEDNWSRIATVEALGKFGTAQDIPLLNPLLKDKDKDVRHAAADALGKIGTVKDIPLLESLLSDIYDRVRNAAANAMKKIVFTAKDIPLIEPLLRDQSSDVRGTTFKGLGNFFAEKDFTLIELFLTYVDDGVDEIMEQIYKRSTPVLRIDRVFPKKKENKTSTVKIFSAQSLHILHISDIHYALDKDPTITCIFHEFLEDIKKWRAQQNNTKIHSICLTGDIAQSGQENQYHSINEKINSILTTTGCPIENLFIIPGNHDVQEYDQISPQGKTLLEQARDNKMNIDTGVLSNEDHYRIFHDKFAHYYRFIENAGYLNSLPENHNHMPKPWYNRKLKDFPVRIMGLNSALFCLKDFCQYGNIRMGTHQFHEAFFQGKVGDPPDNELVILLTHHPVNWLAEKESEDYSTLMERYSVIHLHGHIHKTKIEKKQRLFSSSGGYVSIGTGSLYGEKGTEDINTYHIITLDFEKQELHVWARRWNPDTGKWTVYDDDGNNRFTLPRN